MPALLEGSALHSRSAGTRELGLEGLLRQRQGQVEKGSGSMSSIGKAWMGMPTIHHQGMVLFSWPRMRSMSNEEVMREFGKG